MNQITFQAVRQAQSTNDFQIGSIGETPDGNRWQYVKAATAIDKGAVVVPEADTAVDTVSSSTDSQSRIVYITKASAGWTPGEFINGWVVVDAGTGVGQAGRIKDNTTDTLELYPEYAFSTALAVADSDITISRPYLVDEAAVTSKIQNSVGIAQVAAAANDYLWVLVRGVGSVLAGEALTKGGSFVTGDDTVGQVVKGTTAKGEFDEQTLGRCLVANAAADQLALVFVDIV